VSQKIKAVAQERQAAVFPALVQSPCALLHHSPNSWLIRKESQVCAAHHLFSVKPQEKGQSIIVHWRGPGPLLLQGAQVTARLWEPALPAVSSSSQPRCPGHSHRGPYPPVQVLTDRVGHRPGQTKSLRNWEGFMPLKIIASAFPCVFR